MSPGNCPPAVEEPCDAKLTNLLHASENGKPGATEELLNLVYSELRGMASQKLSRQSPTDTIDATALVDEVWVKLKVDRGAHFASRAHFFAAAAEAMRRVLIDRARTRLAAKRGSGRVDLPIDDLNVPAPQLEDSRLLDLHEALEKFAVLHPQQAELVKLRYFVGMTVEEAATVQGIAVPTAKKWWAYARAWFRIEMS